MKNFFTSFFVLLMAAFTIMSLFTPSSASAQSYTPTQWHALSQSARNEAVYQRATSSTYWLGRNVYPLECLGWVQTVVHDLTGTWNVVLLGSNAWQLQTTAYIAEILPYYGSIPVNRGNIIQCMARLKAGGYVQHTMIIESFQWNGVVVRDCNYVDHNIIGQHLILWSGFWDNGSFKNIHVYEVR